LKRRILKLRYCRRWGPHRISYHLGVPRSTVGRVLRRYRMLLLAHLDQATGLPIRRPKPVRYEAAAPGDLVHVDIKRLGRIPDGGGWRAFRRDSEQHRRAHVKIEQAGHDGAKASRGYVFLHHAVDDHSRLAYSEQLLDERKETAAAFGQRVRGFFDDAGICVKAVMTDKGSCYRSHDFAQALGPGVKHRRTRPYRPQTNGKVERFNRTIVAEWAYAEVYLSDAARANTYARWLHSSNHHRPHTGIAGLVPAARVHNVTGNYT
jgi:transposase InsO family protein